MTPEMLLLLPPLQGCNERVVAAVQRAAVSERQSDIENTHVNSSLPHRAAVVLPAASSYSIERLTAGGLRTTYSD